MHDTLNVFIPLLYKEIHYIYRILYSQWENRKLFKVCFSGVFIHPGWFGYLAKIFIIHRILT